MKRLLATAATCVFAAGLTVALTTPAMADTPGCVTKTEFKHVSRGMSKDRVQHIFDTAGKRDSSTGGGHRYEIRTYKTCSPLGVVSITYRNDKLKHKSGVF